MASRSADTWDWLALHQQAPASAIQHGADADSLAAMVATLEARQHRMALLVQAMRELLEASGLLTTAQLLAKVEEIDLRDGVADGRHTPSKERHCGQCGRVNQSGRQRCLYCGSEDLVAGA